MPVILTKEEEFAEWLSTPADHIDAIQSRILPTSALEIVTDAEAAQYVGGYLK